jgi:hypothetical protein
VQLSFEPAFAGWVSPLKLSLGRSLSLYLAKIDARTKSVGSKPKCGITRTAGQFIYTTKKIGWIGKMGFTKLKLIISEPVFDSNLRSFS